MSVRQRNGAKVVRRSGIYTVGSREEAVQTERGRGGR